MRLAALFTLFVAGLHAQNVAIVQVGQLQCAAMIRTFNTVHTWCYAPGNVLVSNHLVTIHNSAVDDYQWCAGSLTADVPATPPMDCTPSSSISWNFAIDPAGNGINFAVAGTGITGEIKGKITLLPIPPTTSAVKVAAQTGFTWNGSLGSAISGDTNLTSGNSSIDGHIFITSGDARFAPAGLAQTGNGDHMLSMNLTAYDPANIANTKIISPSGFGTNSLAGWGQAGQGQCGGTDAGYGSSADGPAFYLKGHMYLPVRCQNEINWTARDVMLISSGDNGKTWQNWGGLQANAAPDPNGDPVIGTSTSHGFNAIQWTTDVTNTNGERSNRMARLTCMPYGKDTPTGGPTAPAGIDPRLDPSRMYCFSSQAQWTANGGNGTAKLYVHAVSYAAPMAPSSWTHLTSASTGTFGADLMAAVDITPAGVSDTCNGYTIAAWFNPWDKYFYLMLCNTFPIYRGRVPWQMSPIGSPNPLPIGTSWGFSSWIGGLARQQADGSVRIPVTDNYGLPQQTGTCQGCAAMGFFDLVIGAPTSTGAGPVKVGTMVNGKCGLPSGFHAYSNVPRVPDGNGGWIPIYTPWLPNETQANCVLP